MKPTLFVAALLSLSQPLLFGAAGDYFLKIDGIKGESADAAHVGEIEISSFSWGVSNSGATATGGAGKVSMQDFHFVANLDSSSSELFIRCATGQHIPKAVLTVRKAGAAGTPSQEVLQIELENLLVSSYRIGDPPSPTTGISPDGGTGPSVIVGGTTQSLSLNFTKIVFITKDASGASVRTGWDLKTGTKI